MLKLTNRNYFSRRANMEYMSVSQYKGFQKCEARQLAILKGKWKEQQKTTALLVGSYVDAYFEGTLESFMKKNPEIFTRGGRLKSDYEQANDIIKRIEKDKLFMKYLSGEKQVIKTGELFGVPFKIKIDSYFPGEKLVDLKIVRDFEPIYVEGKGRVSFIEAWGYDIQAAVYQAIEGDILPFYIAAATKEKDGSDIDIFQVEQSEMDICLELMEEDVKRYALIKSGFITPDRCGKCDYCRATKKLTGVRSSAELNMDF
jgi:hypothetical protein